MNLDEYKQAFQKIEASDQLKNKLLNVKKRRHKQMKMKYIGIGLAACMLLAVGIFIYQPKAQTNVALDLTERIVVAEASMSTCLATNLSGTIIEVADDGLSFKLDSGKWVEVTDDTIIGITSLTIDEAKNQYFEPTFRVGNRIEGFTEDENSQDIVAYAIYTNWNWDNPIR